MNPRGRDTLDSDASLVAVAKLKALRETMEKEGALNRTVAFVLWDVCGSLEMTPKERAQVLGEKLNRRLQCLKHIQPMARTRAHA